MTRFEKIKKLDPMALSRYIVEEVDCGICKDEKKALEWLAQEVDDEE